MPAVSTKAIKRRIKSVKNTKKITKAMEMVAASKMRRAVERSLASRHYATRALELLINISHDQNSDHPLLHEGTGSKILLVIIASNKGLCGSFNVNVYKELRQYKQSHSEQVIDAVTVGKYAERYARKLSLPIKASFIDFPDSISPEDIRALSKLLIEEFNNGEYRRVRVVFTNFISAMSNRVEIRGLLPVTEEHITTSISDVGAERDSSVTVEKNRQQYIFEPSDTQVLDYVVPVLTEIQLYQSLLESTASEHSARMIAMKNASESAGDMIEQLTLTYNKARQASITQEIMEIASGAEALA